MNEYKEPCQKGCLVHKYHCSVCNTAVSFSPANFASRLEDIPNQCEYCKTNPQDPLQEKQERTNWRERFRQLFTIEGTMWTPLAAATPELIEEFIDREQKRFTQTEIHIEQKPVDLSGIIDDMEQKVRKGDISSWMNYGKENGYWDYFLEAERSRLKEAVEGLRKFIAPGIGERHYEEGFSDALDQVIKLLSD